MRPLLLLYLFLMCMAVHAQRFEPDQNPYWTRYCFVEDSSALLPLQGDFHVYYLQNGQWWSYTPPGLPIVALPEKGMRSQPLFGAGFPLFQATPARGIELPDVKVVVLRGVDTMIVELSRYYEGMGELVNERCKQLDCTRRPPIVLPFRAGRYLPNGLSFAHQSLFTPEANKQIDARTAMLTEQFDALWQQAMMEHRVIPQLNTDTCEQELHLPQGISRAEMPMRDAWLMRSAYCGTHLVHFPAWGHGTAYTITFIPYLPDVKKDPMKIHPHGRDGSRQPVDVTDRPAGDHPVEMIGADSSATFTLKLR